MSHFGVNIMFACHADHFSNLNLSVEFRASGQTFSLREVCTISLEKEKAEQSESWPISSQQIRLTPTLKPQVLAKKHTFFTVHLLA